MPDPESARSGAYLRPRAVPSHSPQPVVFSNGYFAGRTIRVHLEEIQKADLGRKYARKDKRPLDPPPVVLCRYYQVFNRNGCQVEVEVDPTMLVDAICHAELFPVPDTDQSEDAMFGCEATAPNLPPILTPGPHPTSATTARSDFSQAGTSQLHYGVEPPVLSLADQQAEDGIVAWFGSFPIHESSNCTQALAGATFTTAAVIDQDQKPTAMFVLSDLAVQIEGTFVLRYRIFNILSNRAVPPYKPVLAACYGGPFKIYSTKDFPGLLASTPLTKRLAVRGIQVNLRETPRKRRKPGELSSHRGDRDGSGGKDTGGIDSPGSDTARSTSPTASIHPEPGSSYAPSFPSSLIGNTHSPPSDRVWPADAASESHRHSPTMAHSAHHHRY
ncbi:velvet factor-domain-containing protein [Cubamyces lactineus]|nr:velvet factor-domain-containing protein [Cubamyces lactineus]